MVAPVDFVVRELNAERALFGLRPVTEVSVPTVRTPSSPNLGEADRATDAPVA